MVNQKDDRAKAREEEVWELLKSRLAGDSDPAGLARELLRRLAEAEHDTPEAGPAKPMPPEELPKARLKEPAAPPPPDGLSMGDLVRRLIRGAADDDGMGARLKDFLYKYAE